MNKIFLYIYPIKEYTQMFLLKDDSLYDEFKIPRPLPILNECIEKRYRSKGYKVVFVTFPEKEVFGVISKSEDNIIYADISFEQLSAYDEDGRKKENFVPMYANPQYILEQLGNVEEVILGGYHALDCVKKIAEHIQSMGITTLVDLEMTDLFFNVYKETYFNPEEYNIERYKENVIQKFVRMGEEKAKERFYATYSSSVYGFSSKKRLDV